jgi:hypothetical protein
MSSVVPSDDAVLLCKKRSSTSPYMKSSEVPEHCGRRDRRTLVVQYPSIDDGRVWPILNQYTIG